MEEGKTPHRVDIKTMKKENFPHSKLALIARISLALIFLMASIPKIKDPQAFADIVKLYQILPDFLINPAALLIAWLEFVLAILLFTNKAKAGSIILSTMLLGSFILLLIFSWQKGIDIECGCFSNEIRERKEGFLKDILRDLSFLLLSFYLLFYLIKQEKEK